MTSRLYFSILHCHKPFNIIEPKEIFMAIQSVDRALHILTLFSHRRPVLGISEISRAVGLAKATTHGLMRTLLKQGFLQQEPDTKKYRLGLKIYELGVILAGTLEINQKAAGPVNKLSRKVGLLSRVAVWDGESVFITLNVYPRPRAVLPNQIGPRVDAYCSAVGKAVLAFLGEAQLDAYLTKNRLRALTSATLKDPEALLADLAATRRRGYSIDREEVIQGVGCIGAPIFAREGHVVGSISLSGSVAKVLGGRMTELSAALLETADHISQQMGYYPAVGGTDLL